MRARRIAGLIACSIVAACGIDIVGSAQDAGTVVVSTDGAVDVVAVADQEVVSEGSVPVDAPPPPPPGCECTDAIPAGWQQVGLLASRAAACPDGYDALDVVENPISTVQACRCSTCTPTGTKCPSPILMQTGPDACAGGVRTFQATGPAGCNDSSNSSTPIPKFGKLSPFSGSCTAKPTPNAGEVSSASGRLCSPSKNACPRTSLCASTQVGQCVVHDGSVPCAQGSVFAERHLVGSEVKLSCGDTCGCDVTCDESLSLFGQDACKGPETKVAFDGVCRDYGNLNFLSYRYAAEAAPKCKVRGTSAAELELTNTRTICCK